MTKDLMEETENDRVNLKIAHSLGLEELILLKWSFYPKKSTDFAELEWIVLKLIWKHRRFLIAKAILRNRDRAKSIRLFSNHITASL